MEDKAWNEEAIEYPQIGLSRFAYLKRGTYKGETVFNMASCCSFGKMISVAQNCQGELIGDASVNDVANQQVIWRPENSA